MLYTHYVILLYILGLLICFYLLAKVCEQYFVQSLDIISKKLKLSEDVAGATFMAIGSSAPELFTSMIALTKVGSENIGAGTIVGSAIFNILVIVGVSAAVATAYLSWKPVIRDLLFYIFSILVLFFTFRDGTITLAEAGVYIVIYLIYILMLSRWRHWAYADLSPHIPKKLRTYKEEETKEHEWMETMQSSVDNLLGPIFPDLKRYPDKYVRVFVVSVLLIGAISWVLVELAVLLAEALHIPSVIVALTVLAAGTSIPDLLSSVIVARQGRGGMAVSNAVGSNTFDILVGLGFPWAIYILWVGKPVQVSTENLLSSIFLLFCTVITLLMILAMQHFNLRRWSGWFLILLYVVYLLYSIGSVYYPDIFSIDRLL